MRPWSSARSEPATVAPLRRARSAPAAACRCRRCRRRNSACLAASPDATVRTVPPQANASSQDWHDARGKHEDSVRIGVVAPGSRLEPTVAERGPALGAGALSDAPARIALPPAMLSVARPFRRRRRDARATPSSRSPTIARFDALWFARGGYGACRLAERLLPRLTDAARRQDLSRLQRRRLPARRPLPGGLRAPRARADAARHRARRRRGSGQARAALAWSMRAADTLEPTVSPADADRRLQHHRPRAICIGTPLEPDLTGHVAACSRRCRSICTASTARCSTSPPAGALRGASPASGSAAAATSRRTIPTSARARRRSRATGATASGIPYLGRADIGHDADNKVVPFGRWTPRA